MCVGSGDDDEGIGLADCCVDVDGLDADRGLDDVFAVAVAVRVARRDLRDAEDLRGGLGLIELPLDGGVADDAVLVADLVVVDAVERDDEELGGLIQHVHADLRVLGAAGVFGSNADDGARARIGARDLDLVAFVGGGLENEDVALDVGLRRGLAEVLDAALPVRAGNIAAREGEGRCHEWGLQRVAPTVRAHEQ